MSLCLNRVGESGGIWGSLLKSCMWSCSSEEVHVCDVVNKQAEAGCNDVSGFEREKL